MDLFTKSETKKFQATATVQADHVAAFYKMKKECAYFNLRQILVTFGIFCIRSKQKPIWKDILNSN
jgi:hypothetical protein